MISAYRKPTYTNVNKTDSGEREQAGESGNGEMENEKWEQRKELETDTSWRLQPQIFKGVKNRKENSACIFTHTRIKGCGD